MADDAAGNAPISRDWHHPLGHWPHAARRCQDELDLDWIEAQAVRILARGLRSQRLVAFVGAGASMAYGRLTWNGLMGALFDSVKAQAEAADAPPDGAAIWKRISRALWRGDKAEFLKFDDHALKAQVLSIALRQLATPRFGGADEDVPDTPPVDALLWETKFQLEDIHGFIDWVVAQPGAPPSRQQRRQVRDDRLQQARRIAARGDGQDGALGLQGAINVLAQGDEAADRQRLIDGLLNVLHRQSSREDSPIRQLALDWGVRRYITTNYDHEIERGLSQLGFAARTDGPQVHENEYRTLNFGRFETGEALCFALDGPRRHAEILHLHGDVAREASLIVTEQQYQALYLDDHPTRDLVTNATLANFAANPVLFAGSGVNEDDVIRPMRQFMSGEGHRRDRLAVALFPADKPQHELEAQKMRLLLKYGVYVVHFGRTDRDFPPVPVVGKARASSWLGRVAELVRKFTELQGELKQKADDASRSVHVLGMTEADAMWRELRRLPRPKVLDGESIERTEALRIAPQIVRMKRLLPRKSAVATEIPEEIAAWLVRFDRFVLILSITRDWLMSQCLCAKLMNLRRQAVLCLKDDSRPPLVYRRPPEPRGTGRFHVVARHAVSMASAGTRGRFADVPADLPTWRTGETFDEGIESLCATIRAAAHLTAWRGRRVVAICGARGNGKGGQSDRLLHKKTGEPADTPVYPVLDTVTQALQGYEAGPSQVLHVNLSFSNELGPIIGQLAVALERACPPASDAPQHRTSDQLHAIEQGLQRMLDAPERSARLMLILGNAGVLFDGDGYPKNGQVWQVMRLLMSRRFRRAPLDILMYVGESQMPVELRERASRRRGSFPAEERPAEGRRHAGDLRLRRRMDRLNIRVDIPRVCYVVVHALSRTRVSELAAAYFPDVAATLGLTGHARFAERHSLPDVLARRIYMETGGSRFAVTVLLALLETEPVPTSDAPDGRRDAMATLVDDALTALSGPPSGSAIETVIEFSLDRWARRHLLGNVLPHSDGCLQGRAASTGGVPVKLTAQGWTLAFELLWHLGAFSHPVEAEVMLGCPRIWAAAGALQRTVARSGESGLAQLLPLVRATLESLVGWCLAFRVQPRPQPPAVDAWLKDQGLASGRDRFALHRHMQRHIMRLMGGRNVEATQWDQFTITTYASLPDEAPILRAEVHQTLTDVLRTLTDYPGARLPGAIADIRAGAGDIRTMVLEADRIRAAYYLVRSTYSLGVVAHLSPKTADAAAGCGHLEEYRRLVRWISHAARYWERRYGIEAMYLGEGGMPVPDTARAWCSLAAEESSPCEPAGVFYASELVWLHNESGVISLAQGTLQDAEHMLTLAERAAKRLEGDDTGSLHARIRLHAAVVQIERGRPQRARQMLTPISQRRNGHPVPPLLARFYLGQIDHLGGNYDDALGHYEFALTGLRRHRRSRASAFVLLNEADLVYAMRPDRLDEALARVNEAISLAQQGGHEDLRMLAVVARCRIGIEARDFVSPDRSRLFEQLSAAERYAIRMDIPRLSCEVHELRARMLLGQGEYQLSARDATASLEIAALYDMKVKKARGLLTLAHIYLGRGQTADARSLATMGRDIANSCDYYTCVRGFNELDLMLDGSKDQRPSSRV